MSAPSATFINLVCGARLNTKGWREEFPPDDSKWYFTKYWKHDSLLLTVDWHEHKVYVTRRSPAKKEFNKTYQVA